MSLRGVNECSRFGHLKWFSSHCFIQKRAFSKVLAGGFCRSFVAIQLHLSLGPGYVRLITARNAVLRTRMDATSEEILLCPDPGTWSECEHNPTS